MRFLFLTVALTIAAGASAQSAPQTLPGLDNFSLPASRPTPQPVPTAEPTTTPRAQPTGPATPFIQPLPTATPTPRATRTPSPQRTSAPTAQRAGPATAPSVAAPTIPPDEPAPAAPAASRAAPPTGQPVPADTSTTSETGWLLPIGGALIVLAALAWFILRPRRRVSPDSVGDTLAPEPALAPPEPEPIAAPAEPTSAPVTPVRPPRELERRADIALHFRVLRAGTNLLNAAVEYELVIRNAGTAPARNVLVDIRMLTASGRQDEALHRIFATAIDRPTVTPFPLAPGEATDLGGMAQMPPDQIAYLPADGRKLFVPVFAVTARYGWDGGDGQTSQAWVIGRGEGEGSKLAPFAADRGARMFDRIVVREYPVGVRR